MKKTFHTDIRRSIWKQKVSFISILVIAMLAVTAFLGINFSAYAMKKNAADYYRDLHFRDLEITSTQLIGPEDLKALKEVEGVADVEGVFSVDANLEHEGEYERLSVVSLTERINTVSLREGRLPKTKDECVIEWNLMNKLGLKVGDHIDVRRKDGGDPKYLKNSSFTITGSVLHPDHYAKASYIPGNRYVLVNKDVFDSKSLEGFMMKALIVMDKPAGMGVFDKGYEEKAAELKKKMEPLIKEREEKRTADIRKKADDLLKEAEDKLTEAKQKLDDGRRQLDEGEQKLKDLEATAANGKSQLDSGKVLLDNAQAQLASGKSQLDAGRAGLDAAKAQMDEGGAQLLAGLQEAENLKTQARDLLRETVTEMIGAETADQIHWAAPVSAPDLMDPSLSVASFAITDSYSVYIGGSVAQLLRSAVEPVLAPVGMAERADEIISKLEATPEYQELDDIYRSQVADKIATWENGHAQYIDGANQYYAGEAAYAEKLAQYQNGLSQYEAGLAEYNRRYAQYEEGLRLIATGREELTKREAEYQDGLKQYEEGRKTYEDWKAYRDKLLPCRWIPLGVSENNSFVHAKNAAENIGKLGLTFAMMFVVVGALVIYVTVGRIIEESRRLVGAQKALGFFSGEIRTKYLVFGISATFVGMLLGAVLGYYMVEGLILRIHNVFYVTDPMKRSFLFGTFGIVLAAGILLAGLAVWLACHRLLKETAKSLMAAKAPEKALSRSAAGSSGGSLYSKLIFRNMRNDIARILVTIVSIAGCCILLMIGFTLNTNIRTTISSQFLKFTNYEASVIFEPSLSETAETEIEQLLEEAGASYITMNSALRPFRTGDAFDSFIALCPEKNEVQPYFQLKDVKTGKDLSLPESGVVFPSRTAEAYHLSVGDTFTMYDENMTPHEVKIGAIATMHYCRQIFLSPSAYREIFNEEPKVNAIYYAREGKEPDEALIEKLRHIRGVDEVERLSAISSNFRRIASSLTSVTMILLVAAAIMAYFILMNLVSMYLAKKKLELTVMRINGYSSGEVIRYCLMESVFTTAAGILLGLVAGAFLALRILAMLQHPHAGFDLSVNWVAIGISAAITAFFSIVIHMIALQKIRKLKLTDIE